MSIYSNQCFILLFNIDNFVNENISNPIAKTPRPINNVVPAFGNSAGGSVNLNFGVTSDVWLCSVPSKSL